MKLMNLLYAGICFALCCIPVDSSAQQMLFGNYSTAQGLPSSMVLSISQDDKGYMWFGTRNGLSRFDGYQFKNFQFRKNEPGSIGNNFIHCIRKHDSTHFWIGTENGVYILDLENENFTELESTKGETVFDILIDNKGLIWMTTRSNGLYQYNPANNSFSKFNVAHTGSSISSNKVSDLIQDDDGNIWIGTFDNGIDIFDPAKKTFSNISKGESGLTSDNVITLYKGLNGVIWVGTLNGGLFKWQKDQKKFKNYKSGAPFAIRDNIVRAIYQTSPDKLYVGTEKGLNVLDIKTDKFVAHTNRIDDPFTISDNAVYSIFLDKAGTMWIGTWFGGVSFFHEGGSPFELYYPGKEENALHGRAVSCFLEDTPGKFWVGTEDGGLYYFDSYKKTFLQYPFSPGQDNLSYHNVHSLLKDKHGNIWIGLFAGGVNILDPKTGKITRHTHQPENENTLTNDLVFSFYEDADGIIWVGTASGLNRYDETKKSFVRIDDEDIANALIYDIYDDKAGKIWLATWYNAENGLVALDKQKRTWEKITADKKSNLLSSAKLVCIHDDHRGNLWIGTDGGGLNRMNSKTREVKTYDEKDGITANIIYGIQEDNKGSLWLTTNNGIYSLNPETGTTKHFTSQDNLQGQQFNYRAFYKASDGKLFAGGIKGFNAFYPDSLIKSEPISRVSFTNFQLFNKNVSLSDKNAPLSRQISYTDKVTLDHDQSVFSFEFALLNTSTPEKIRYAYKMDGFDEEWNFVGGQRKATYTNLSPGTYQMRVKATNDESNWKVPEAVMTIIIRPPFYRSTLSYILYALFLLGLIYALYRYSAERIRRKNKVKLEKLKTREEQEFYARKIEFFTVMAHEIRTPLSLIIAPLEKLLLNTNWAKDEKEQLTIMDENADRLLNLVNQLLDFRRIESDAYKIKKEKMEIVSLVHALYSRFSSLSYQKGVDFTWSTNVDNALVLADPEVLNKILSNLLINAFRFARKMVKITLNDSPGNSPQNRVILIRIEDDGIGIPEADIKNIFKRFFTTRSGNHQYHNLGGTGIGLALASSLAEKHGAQLLVNSKEGIRTEFTLKLDYIIEKEIIYPENLSVSAPGQETDDPMLPHILVVEDDLGLQTFIEKSLRSEGYSVITSADGNEAIKCLEKARVDLIISDLMMPGMDGYEFCAHVKSNINYSHIPFVILTAKGNTEAEIKGIETGADAYLLKPFKWKHVTAVVKNLLNSRELLKSRFSDQPTSDISVLTTNTRDKDFMDKIVSIIRARIVDPRLSVEELSRDMTMSRSSLHKKLKSLSGYGPNELIRLIRLKHAAKLLQENSNSIAEVAYMTGFSTPSYFSKCFQQQFKLTPKEFADNYLKKNQGYDKDEVIDGDDFIG
jgi:signal transduction histidine kinase/ligand-binding sensor domain-containing protein/DNA-binding response OmpR family regulator